MKNYGEKLLNKPLKKGDITVCAILLVVVALTFFTALFKPKTEALGFAVYLGGNVVLTCDFSGKNVDIKDRTAVEKIDDVTYKIFTEKSYNVVKIDYENESVAVTDADCAGKECVKMNFKDGIIVCAPHSLTIRPTGVEQVPRVG